MTSSLTRRGFLAAGAALGVLPPFARADSSVLSLIAGSRTLEINGRAARVYGLTNRLGGQGLILDPDQRFQVQLTNALEVETLIHWHGQIPPNAQDGVPDMPMKKLTPGESRNYDFAAQPGTHWMHSHIPTQEMQLLAAPLIVRRAKDLTEDRQEVVMFLHDFSFRSPEEVLAQLTDGAALAGMEHDMSAAPESGSMDMSAMGHGAKSHGAMSHGAKSHGAKSHGAMSHGGMAMDLNDVNFDAYLTNDRTLADPQHVKVDIGGRVRMRIINASAATTYWIDTGALEAALVAVDGQDVLPLKGRRFGIAMAQRLDLELDLPAGQGAFPILALREGARAQTGLILATAGAAIRRIDDLAETASPAFDLDLAQESQLRALRPLPERAPARAKMVMLAGSMAPYVWTINGQTWGSHQPITAKTGERVELTFHNMSMMGHPMHLHGHAFQVVQINGRRFAGALRDTVYVPPMSQLTIALDAGEAARWMLHCHHMPHLASGMMTEFAVQAS